MNVITAVSSKGGVIKTTLISNLGALLADCGYRVLLIDADNTQPALSSHYPLDHRAPDGLKRLIRDRCIDADVISKTSIQGLDIIVSDDPRDSLPEFILHEADGRYRIRQAMDLLETRSRYDFVMIDTRGARGPVLDAAMLATDIFLSPISPDIVSAREFYRGTVDAYRNLKESARWLNIQLAPLYSILTRVERTRDAKDIACTLTEAIADSDDIFMLDTRVPSSTVYKAAASAQTPVHVFDAVSRGKRPSARDTMVNALNELFALHRQHCPDFVIPAIDLTGGADHD